MKNTKYCIIQANSCKELESLVNKKLNDSNWDLHGTIVIDSWEGGTNYHQVLISQTNDAKMLTD